MKYYFRGIGGLRKSPLKINAAPERVLQGYIYYKVCGTD
jgi:hypothetical protein